MRLAITLGFLHDTAAPEVITGAEVPPHVQKKAMHDFKGATEHPKYERVEIWHSDAGVVSRKRLAKPESKTDPEIPESDPPAAKKPQPKKK
jgi:hypothetical protein